jgi:hypothetical protein
MIREPWHNAMIEQLSDVLLSSMVQSLTLSSDFWSVCSEDQQAALKKIYGESKALCTVGLIQESAKRIGMDLPGLSVTSVPESHATGTLYELLFPGE